MRKKQKEREERDKEGGIGSEEKNLEEKKRERDGVRWELEKEINRE